MVFSLSPVTLSPEKRHQKPAGWGKLATPGITVSLRIPAPIVVSARGGGQQSPPAGLGTPSTLAPAGARPPCNTVPRHPTCSPRPQGPSHPGRFSWWLRLRGGAPPPPSKGEIWTEPSGVRKTQVHTDAHMHTHARTHVQTNPHQVQGSASVILSLTSGLDP